MSKAKLPKDWIVVNSKNHPDRVYYFNVKTNKSSWEMPASNKTAQMSSKVERKSKRFKKDSVGVGPSGTTPTTPDGKSSKNIEEECKSTKKRKFEAKGASKMTESKETPQMQILREKIAQKKAKQNLAKSNLRTTMVTKSPPKPVNAEKVAVPSVNETENDATNAKTEAWTPQMIVIYEKMKQKSSKSSSTEKTSRFKKTATSNVNDVIEKQDRVKLRASRIKNTRSGRSGNNKTANNSTFVHTVTENDMDAECNVSKETFSGGKREREVSTSSLEDQTSGKEYESASRELSDKVNLVKRPRISLKKNIAKDRLEVLRTSLSFENEEIDSIVNNVSRRNKSLPNYAHNTESLPNLCKNVEVRLKHLHKQSPRKVFESNARGSKKSANNNKSLSNPVATVNKAAEKRTEELECEEMDWEPMEDETITCEVQTIRSQLCINRSTNTAQCISGDTLESPFLSGQENKTLYIVIDTNVFLSNIEAIEKARDITFKHYGQPIIVIPWTVIRELDYIKDDKFHTRHESLRAKARKAVRFLNNHFVSKHPRIIGQTAENVAKNKEKFAADCPDDEILQTCLQIRDLGKFVVLFSYDKNLSNKAMIHDIITLGRNDPLEKIDYFASNPDSASNNRNEYPSNLCEKRKQGLESPSILKEELRMSSEVLEDTKTVVKDFLTVVITKEMQNLFGDNWENHTTIKPPWTVMSALKCAIKHWIAAVSESFHRRAEPILKEILKAFTDIPEDGKRLRDVGHILERCSDLIQMVNVDKHPELMIRASDKIDEFRKKCLEYDTRINQKKLRDEVGVEDDAAEQERKAAKAFQYFELIYAYGRDVGGMAAEAAGMPCNFCYKIPDPAPTIEYLKQIQPEVAANVNRLLHVLSLALERLDKSCMDHRTLNSLYQVLTTFLPEIMTINAELTPLDVYYCLKQKEQMLKEGLRQLQELSIHFCRLANYRST